MNRDILYRCSCRQSAKLLSILVLCLAFSGCSVAQVFKSVKHAEAPASDPIPHRKNVEIAKIAKSQIANLPEVSADIVPSVSMDITAKSVGVIEQILKRSGDKVQVGDVLIKLSSTEIENQREKAYLSVTTVQNALDLSRTNKRNELSQAEQQLADLTKSYNKLKNYYDEGLTTEAQVDEADAQRVHAQTALARLRLSNGSVDLEVQLRNAQLSLQQADEALAALDVKAPISGSLINLSVQQGASLNVNAKIGVIQKLDPIKMTAQIPSQNVEAVNGKKELAYNVTGTTIKGKAKLSNLAGAPDPKTNLYALDLEAPNKEMVLKPGMKAQIQLADMQSLEVVTVPTYSIIKQGENAYVFVLVNDVVEKRSIQLGRLNEPNQEVISGVKEGELVVISGQNDLKDGEKVQLASVQAATK